MTLPNAAMNVEKLDPSHSASVRMWNSPAILARGLAVSYNTTWNYHLCSVAQSCLTPCDPMDCSPPGSAVHGIVQARILGCHFLLQGIFPTKGSNLRLLHLLHWQADSLPLCPWAFIPEKWKLKFIEKNYMDACGSFICNSPNWRQPQRAPTGNWVNKLQI